MAEQSSSLHRGTPTAKSRRRSILSFVRDLVIIVVIALCVSFLIKTFLIRSFYIPSGSMRHTLELNDHIIVNELVPGVMPLKHGDVVVFSDPGGWLSTTPAPPANAFVGGIDTVLSFIGLSASDSENHLVKRVIGLPGDTVSCCTALGQMTVNGTALNEPYVTKPAGQSDVSGVPFTVTVPDDMLWVMGDNRYNSADSRYNRDKPGNGFVPFDDVVGRAVVISWPISRWSVLSDYPEVFRGVESSD